MQIANHQILPLLRYRDSQSPTEAEITIRKRFLERYPSQEANIIKYQDNPGCQCAGQIIQAMGGDSTVLNESLTYILGEPITVILPKNVAGELFEIENTPSAWKNFYQRMQSEMFIFRGIQIIPNGSNITVYFY